MTNQELANLITERFTPFAFLCDCKGTHPDCASLLNSDNAWVQTDTVYRIAKFIETLED
jgi:hypothetical protein